MIGIEWQVNLNCYWDRKIQEEVSCSPFLDIKALLNKLDKNMIFAVKTRLLRDKTCKLYVDTRFKRENLKG